jgi:hypothetical protein
MTRSRTPPVALGFRAHSGWAALVAVSGPSSSPSVCDRRRVELLNPGVPAQPYHAAAELDFKEAEQLVKRSVDKVRLRAVQGVREVIDDLRKQDRDVVGCGILLGSGRPLTTLTATLASHALIHTAEGELFRQALVCAAQECGLPVTGVKERELFSVTSDRLLVPSNELEKRLADWGRALGPPWRQDQKYAALAAWLALAAR